MNFQIYADYVTKLISSFIKNGEAIPLPKELDAETLFNFCRFHKIESLVYLALKDAAIPDDAKNLFKVSYLRAINKMAKQQYYIEKVENTFEESGIDYFILKGRELAKLYPSPDMRQSSDFDIYVGGEKGKLARDIMVDLGFEIKYYAEDSGHDQYFIDKSILCEVDRMLVDENFPWKEECYKIPERVVKCENTNHCFKMTKEDFYLYNLAHAANHIKAAGAGIKMFIDLWLVYSEYKDEFDYSYLKEKLELAHLTKFEEYARELFLHWFEDKKIYDETVAALEIFVAQSGWIGTYSQYSSQKLAKNAENSKTSVFAKIKNYWTIIFPTLENLYKRYPNAEKYKILIPYYYVYRIIKSVFGKDKGAQRVISEITTGDLEEGKYILKLKKDIGL